MTPRPPAHAGSPGQNCCAGSLRSSLGLSDMPWETAHLELHHRPRSLRPHHRPSAPHTPRPLPTCPRLSHTNPERDYRLSCGRRRVHPRTGFTALRVTSASRPRSPLPATSHPPPSHLLLTYPHGRRVYQPTCRDHTYPAATATMTPSCPLIAPLTPHRIAHPLPICYSITLACVLKFLSVSGGAAAGNHLRPPLGKAMCGDSISGRLSYGGVAVGWARVAPPNYPPERSSTQRTR